MLHTCTCHGNCSNQTLESKGWKHSDPQALVLSSSSRRRACLSDKIHIQAGPFAFHIGLQDSMDSGGKIQSRERIDPLAIGILEDKYLGKPFLRKDR